MILRPFDPPPVTNEQLVPAWPAVERLQRQQYESCWMITQPSHAALAGEIAAKLVGPQIPEIDGRLIRAIALHDAGWGIPDAQAIARSRASRHTSPKSFLQTQLADALAAWGQSIETAQTACLDGGNIVSRHFCRIAEQRVASAGDTAADRKNLQEFIARERQRQKKLASKQAGSAPDLELLTDLLQFCDLLSLYICCGARDWVEFPEYFGVRARLRVEAQSYALEPPWLEPGCQFRVAALRYPATKEESSREIQVKIG